MTSFEENVATRSLGRFYPWILTGLAVLYIVTFPIFKSPILVTVPVTIAGWFYYRRGGILAAILAIPLDFFLISLFVGSPNWDMVLALRNGFWIGHVSAGILGIVIGYLRTGLENVFRLDKKLKSQERFLVLSNIITKKILTPTRSDKLFSEIADHLTNLFVADHGYIARWDPIQQKLFWIAATNSMSYSLNIEINSEDSRIIEDVLQTGQVHLIEDIKSSPCARIDFLKDAQSAICVPLVAREYKFGTAILVQLSPRKYTTEEQAYAEQIGNQIALALWMVKQDEVSLQQLNETKTLMQIGHALSETERVGLQVVLQLIVDSAIDLIPKAEKAVIHIINAEENILEPMAIAGYLEKVADNLRVKMQMGQGVAGQVIKEGVTINISDVETDPRFLKSSGEATYRSLMVAPIQIDQQQIGTVSVQSNSKSAFSAGEEELLNALAIDAAIAIDNTRSFETIQQRLKEVNALYGTIKVFAGSLNPGELANDVVTLLEQNFGFYYVQFYLLDAENRDLVLKAGSGKVGEQLLREQFRLSRGAGIVGHVAETGEPFVTNSVNDVMFFERNSLLPDTQFELAVPVKIGLQVIGVLDIQDKPPKQLTQSDLQLVQAVADQLAVALDKANLYTDLQNAMKQEQAIRSQLIQSERLALVGRLLASVSHELNNPLQAIQNALFLLKEETGISGQGRQDLDIVLSETERMAALIERLRSAYRPMRDKDFQQVPINNLIEDVYALISTHMRHKKITFEFVPDPELQPAFGIADQLRQVVLNLFLNAVEVMDPGGCLTVQTRNLTEQSEVLFSVRDTGPGIDAEILPKIFDAFVTSKRTGTGLGLTITHDILEQHRGRISAANASQGGAVFYVWLPMCERE